MNTYDLVVIGSGPGGYVAAIRGAQRGLNTALVEKEHIGGICLNWGCIPTKAIIRSVNALRDIQNAEELGIDIEAFSINMDKIIERSRDVAGRLSKGVEFLLKKNNVSVFKGTGRVLADKTVEVKAEDDAKDIINADSIIIATGASTKSLPHIPIDGQDIISSREALELKDLPGSMAVMGAGAIGVEFAYIYKHLGVDVTIIEALDALLPNEDEEISKEVLKNFKKQKIKSLISTKVIDVKKTSEGLELKLSGPKGESNLVVDKLLSAVGVRANTEQIIDPELGLELENGFIKVNGKQQTNIPGIFAIGDVAGNPCLAHKASKEALIAIDSIQGKDVKALNKDHIPGCTYCEPQVASVGLSEKQAADREIEYKVSKVHYRAIGKAIASGHIDGFMKFVVDAETEVILGAHCVGSEATELVAELTLAVTKGMTVHDLADTIHAHPTLSELTMETAENASGEAIHV